MEEIQQFNSIREYNDFNNNETYHPLVNVVHLDKASPRQLRKLRYGFYTVFLKQIYCGDLRYGLSNYDYEGGSLIFLAPNQVIGENADSYYQPQGIALVFHPDLIAGTGLSKHIDDYHFFSYAVNEALHLSEHERKVVEDCFAKIEYELHHAIDKHSKQLILTNIELFLNYCVRFYDRQFITRDNVNKGVLEKFELALNSYFDSQMPQSIGLPSVSWCAEQLNLSSNYFGDLIKKETGNFCTRIYSIQSDKISKESHL